MFSLPFSCQSEIELQKPIDQVFKVVSDFQSWPKWSPWLCQEPDCSVEVHGEPCTVGHQQQWNGKNIGSGEIRLSGIEEPHRLSYDLIFLKPWRSHSKAGFEFAKTSQGSKVVWTMEGTVPFFLFFLRSMMSAWVKNDFDRGLRMMKEFIENGKVPTAIDVRGQVERSGFYYVGLERSCSTQEMGTAMQQDIDKLGHMVERGELPKPDFVFSIYHKFDVVRQNCHYTSALAYKNRPSEQLPQDVKFGKLAGHRALQVNHIGPYRHLGNAWSAAMGCQRSAKMKPSKAIPMYEVYVSRPGEVTEEQLKTEIFLPLR